MNTLYLILLIAAAACFALAAILTLAPARPAADPNSPPVYTRVNLLALGLLLWVLVPLIQTARILND